MLYRGEELELAPYQNLFLDMEENIHIHYRDLRIELSRVEFEEFRQAFIKQSAELQAIIDDKDYQDGKLPNANQEDVRIWTDSRLEHPVKYHPKRISIEQCTDGYHLHLRNYKFLFSRADFTSFYLAISGINLDVAYASSRKEILQLFKDNDLDFIVAKESQKYSYIHVANYHLSKICSICEKIGLARELVDNVYHFKNDKISIMVSSVMAGKMPQLLAGTQSPLTDSALLVEYLLKNNTDNSIDKNRLNHVKCQILNCFNYIEKNHKTSDIDLNYLNWNYDIKENKVIFPFMINASNTEFHSLEYSYKNWTDFLKEQNLYFIKPSKIPFNREIQAEIRHQIYSRLVEQIASIKEVAKIYIMGSLLREDMGIYASPFVHGKLAKLGSDIDILIEMEDKNSKLPDNWQYINQSQSNSCDIYHLSEIALIEKVPFQVEFPHINFLHHLIDAFIYFPQKSHKNKKNDFLKQFSAKLFYSNNKKDNCDIQFEVEQDVANPWGEETQEDNSLVYVKKHLEKNYGLTVNYLRKMEVATENSLFQFSHLNQDFILKCYQVSGNYSSNKLLEHTHYEAGLVDKLFALGVKTSKLIKTLKAERVSLITFSEGNSIPAVLYTYAHGFIYKYPIPSYPIKEATQALAILHDKQIENPLVINEKASFSFDDIFNLWHPVFNRFKKSVMKDKELSACFSKLKGLYQQHKNLYQKINNNTDILQLHNHGDVTPRNFVITPDSATILDFQNAFYGPRILDVIDGAFEFSFGGKLADKNDFKRFYQFIESYQRYTKLSAIELSRLDDAINVCGLIKFIKEVRMIKGCKNKDNLRRLRALSTASFLVQRSLKI